MLSFLNRDTRTAFAVVVPFQYCLFELVILLVSLFVLFFREDVDAKIGRRLSKFLRQWHCRSCPRGEDEAASVPQDGRPEACCGAPVSPLILSGRPLCSQIPCTLGAASALSSRRTGIDTQHPSAFLDAGRTHAAPPRPSPAPPLGPHFSPDWRPSSASTSAAAIAHKPAT